MASIETETYVGDVRAWRLFLASAAGGWLIWLSADSPSGRQEPWDAENQLPYILAQGLLGVVFGVLEPRGFWRWALGIYAGQAIALVHSALSAAEASLGLFFPLGSVMK